MPLVAPYHVRTRPWLRKSDMPLPRASACLGMAIDAAFASSTSSRSRPIDPHTVAETPAWSRPDANSADVFPDVPAIPKGGSRTATTRRLGCITPVRAKCQYLGTVASDAEAAIKIASAEFNVLEAQRSRIAQPVEQGAALIRHGQSLRPFFPTLPRIDAWEEWRRISSSRPLILLVGAARFELATPSPPDWCANRAALRSEMRRTIGAPTGRGNARRG
jgi:hypothetical protein